MTAPATAGLLLAAGAGRRFGMPKALVPHRGALLVDHAVRTLADGGCVPIVIVTGAAAEQVAAHLGAVTSGHTVSAGTSHAADEAAAHLAASTDQAAAHLAAAPASMRVVVNTEWATGMGSSLRVGLAAVAEFAVDAVVVLTVDTPGVTAAAVRRLAALAASGALARATYDGRPGHPVLLGRDHWAGAAAAAVGDTGARPYLASRHVTEVPCADIADGADADRPDDLT